MDQRKIRIQLDIMQVIRELLKEPINTTDWCSNDAVLFELIAKRIRETLENKTST